MQHRSVLETQWRSGAFQGADADEAYFVRCDRTTMTRADLDAGTVNVVVGFALLKPAEFVVLRIGLKAAREAPDQVAPAARTLGR